MLSLAVSFPVFASRPHTRTFQRRFAVQLFTRARFVRSVHFLFLAGTPQDLERYRNAFIALNPKTKLLGSVDQTLFVNSVLRGVPKDWAVRVFLLFTAQFVAPISLASHHSSNRSHQQLARRPAHVP
jgi:hypothetical protein